MAMLWRTLGTGAMEKLERLHRNANQCRSLADCAPTPEGREVLLEIARDYEDRAATLHATNIESFVALPMDSKRGSTDISAAT
jgi:hypothetical protein